jgi:hypothetical protein
LPPLANRPFGLRLGQSDGRLTALGTLAFGIALLATGIIDAQWMDLWRLIVTLPALGLILSVAILGMGIISAGTWIAKRGRVPLAERLALVLLIAVAFGFAAAPLTKRLDRAMASEPATRLVYARSADSKYRAGSLPEAPAGPLSSSHWPVFLAWPGGPEQCSE